MKAEIVAVGTELLMGQISNTNAQFLSQKLPAVGIGVYYHSVVGDNAKRLKETLSLAMKRSDVIVLTGGLGPTQDDLTKETVAEVLGLKMIFDEESAANIKEYFSKQNKEMIGSNLKQAYFPAGAIILYNDKGTAPGCIIESDGKVIIMLPGPPNEMIPMYNKCVEPYFSEKSVEKLASSYVKIIGMGEAKVESVLMPLIDNQQNPTFATYAKTGDVTLRITASAKKKEDAGKILERAVSEVRNIIGKNIYSTSGETPEEVLIKRYIAQGKTIATCESCTGGLLAEMLTRVPGASGIMEYGFVTYSNDAKHNLIGVPYEVLNEFGAVSKETVEQMCYGLKNISGASTCISISGIAGPDGGTPEKPVGLVYIGILFENEMKCFECCFNGSRERIRVLAAMKVLEELLVNF